MKRSTLLGALVPPLRFSPDALFRVPTADGSAITLGRYLPRSPARFEEPVVLAHSLGTNRFNLDFDERYSLARALARRGFEAWVLELRGHGLSGHAGSSSFDLEARFDVPAALGAITSTGPARVLWVGHSRGGLLGLAHLARSPHAPIAAVAALASPLSFSAQPQVQRFARAVRPTLKLDVLPLALAAKAAAPFGFLPPPLGDFFARTANMDATVVR
jgi:alpha-beta hydrolase superfamily lysophospholipase